MRQDGKAPVIDGDFDDAIRHYGEGRLPQAEKICQKILADDPDHPKALGMLGVIAYAAGEADRALELLSRAIAVKPDYAEAHSNLGNLFRDLGRLAEAEESYRRALDLKPEFADFHNNLGVTLTALGRLDAAVASCRQAITLNPDLAEAHNSLGSALHASGRLEEAIPVYHKALAIKPDYAEAHSNLGITLKELGRLDEAIPSFHKALAIDPDYAEAHNNLGNAFQELEKLDEAVASFHKALAVKPDFAEAHGNLGIALQEQGRLDEAVESYRKALAINPDNAETHNNLGKTLMIKGEREEAISCFEEVLNLDAGDKRTAAELALAHLGIMGAPSRTPEKYMKGFYKTKARNYSKMRTWNHNTETYQGHKLISNILKVEMKGRTNLRILDAGCGTGTLASFLRPYGSHMSGVDLSQDMLLEARRKGLYDSLVEDDVDHYLSQSGHLFDLVVSAAVLIHFSELKSVFSKIWNVLDKEGLFALTLFVDNECEEFSVNSFGFFSHNPKYVKRIGSRSGFNLIDEEQGLHESHGRQEIFGAAYLFQK